MMSGFFGEEAGVCIDKNKYKCYYIPITMLAFTPETLTPSEVPTERIDDVAKAHEMAKAGDHFRTIAALDRAAARLMSRMVVLGASSKETTAELRSRHDVGSEHAERIKYAALGRRGGVPRQDVGVVRILSEHVAPAMDRQADLAERAAGERYDRRPKN